MSGTYNDLIQKAANKCPKYWDKFLFMPVSALDHHEKCSMGPKCCGLVVLTDPQQNLMLFSYNDAPMRVGTPLVNAKLYNEKSFGPIFNRRTEWAKVVSLDLRQNGNLELTYDLQSVNLRNKVESYQRTALLPPSQAQDLYIITCSATNKYETVSSALVEVTPIPTGNDWTFIRNKALSTLEDRVVCYAGIIPLDYNGAPYTMNVKAIQQSTNLIYEKPLLMGKIDRDTEIVFSYPIFSE